MSVFMIIVSSLVTALFAIGIISGVVMSAITVFRLITGKGVYSGKELNRAKRILISAVCILNAFALLMGGYFGVKTYQIHKDEIWGVVKQQSQQDNILPDYMQDNSENVSAYTKETTTAYSLYENRQITLPAGTATYVLVPGGGHGAWCYEPVKMLLEDAGQTVYAVSLPGVGEQSDELTSETDLEDHISAVSDFITEHDLSDVILVGHSYGGMVITGVADRVPNRIKNIVYLDAVHPSDGQSLLDAQPLVQYVPVVSQPREVNGVEVNLYPDNDTIAFLGLTEPVDIVFAKEHLTPHPWKTFTDTLHLENPDIVAQIGKTDIYTKTTLDGLLQTGIATPEEAAQAMVIDTGHDLMITEPELTADMLLNTAAGIYDIQQ